MNRARDELLADAALAANQHGDVAVGDLLDDERDLAHRGAVAPADERLALIVAQLPAQVGELVDQAVALDRLLDRRVERDLAEPFGIVRLDDVVGGAEAHGFDDDLRLLAARQHDHLQLGARRLERLQRLQAVHAGHRDVEQHDVGRLALADRGDDLVAARIRARFVAAQREKRAQVPGESGVVVDDGDRAGVVRRWSRFAASAARAPATVVIVVLILRFEGVSRSAEPARGRSPGADQSAPPCASMTRRATGKRESEAAAPFVERRRRADARPAISEGSVALVADREHRPRRCGVGHRRAVGHDDARFAALAQRCVHQRRDRPRRAARDRRSP